MLKTSIDPVPDRAMGANGPARGALAGATMGTRYSAIFYCCEAIELADLRNALQSVVDEVDAEMSPWKPNSTLMQFNALGMGNEMLVPDCFAEVAQRALEVAEQSDWAFDPCVLGLVDQWGFGAGTSRQLAPWQQQSDRTSSGPYSFEPSALRMRKLRQVELDFCGIAKGYAVDQMATVLEHFGLMNYLVSIDGEVRLSGAKANGDPWTLAVESPLHDQRDVLLNLEITDAALATSGNYRQVVEREGCSHSHTMDGRTGMPVQNQVASVTVASATCMDADAWATAMMVLGEEQGLKVAERMDLNVLMIVRDGNDFRLATTGCFAGVTL